MSHLVKAKYGWPAINLILLQKNKLSVLLFRPLRRLIRSAEGVRDVCDYIVAVVDHPIVSVDNGIARMHLFDTLREDRVIKHAAVLRDVAQLRHIGEDAVDFDMAISLL